MDQQLQDQIRNLANGFTEFKEAHTREIAQLKGFGGATEETKGKVREISLAMTGIEEKIEALMKAAPDADAKYAAMVARVDELEAAAKRRAVPTGTDVDEAKKAAQEKARVFEKMLRHPEHKTHNLTDAEYKTLQESIDTRGGYTAPAEWVAELVTNIVEWSNVRPLFRTYSTGADEVQWPRRITTAAAAWVSETGLRDETQNPEFGLLRIQTHEMHALAKVTLKLLEDSQFNLMQYLMDEFSEQFGVSQGRAFLLGTGAGQPTGILTTAGASDGVPIINSGSAATVTADSMITTWHYIKEAYQQNASWILNRSTLAELRKFKDSQNRYLWDMEQLAVAKKPTFLGSPYTTAPDMPVLGANNLSVLWGDWKRAYLVVDRVGITTMLDPYTSKRNGMMEISARLRVGGGLRTPEAGVALKCST